MSRMEVLSDILILLSILLFSIHSKLGLDSFPEIPFLYTFSLIVILIYHFYKKKEGISRAFYLVSIVAFILSSILNFVLFLIFRNNIILSLQYLLNLVISLIAYPDFVVQKPKIIALKASLAIPAILFLTYLVTYEEHPSMILMCLSISLLPCLPFFHLLISSIRMSLQKLKCQQTRWDCMRINV